MQSFRPSAFENTELARAAREDKRLLLVKKASGFVCA